MFSRGLKTCFNPRLVTSTRYRDNGLDTLRVCPVSPTNLTAVVSTPNPLLINYSEIGRPLSDLSLTLQDFCPALPMAQDRGEGMAIPSP